MRTIFYDFKDLFQENQIKEIFKVLKNKNDWSKNEEIQIDTMIGNYLISVMDLEKGFVHIRIEMIDSED